jgi:hypothetical protein
MLVAPRMRRYSSEGGSTSVNLPNFPGDSGWFYPCRGLGLEQVASIRCDRIEQIFEEGLLKLTARDD